MKAETLCSGLAGVLLMGGASRRMGRDKARLSLDGTVLGERQWELLKAVAHPVYRTLPYGSPEEEGVFADRTPSPGPLPGIARVLGAMPTEWLLVLAVDIVGVGEDVVARLLRERTPGGVTMIRVRGEAQPLCAVWHRGTKPAVEAALAEGARSLRAVLARVPTRILNLPAAAAARIDHLNTPDDVGAYEFRRRRRWLQVVGLSRVGKTALLSELLPRLLCAGETAVVVKVSHHPVQERPGRDTSRLLEGGAEAAWLMGPDGLFREGAGSPSDLLALATGAWLLVEGGRTWATPKIVLGKAAWPAHAKPVVGSVGALSPLAALHLELPMPEAAATAAAWLFEHRFELSVPLDEVSDGHSPD